MVYSLTVEVMYCLNHLGHDIPGLFLREAFVFCLFYAFKEVVRGAARITRTRWFKGRRFAREMR